MALTGEVFTVHLPDFDGPLELLLHLIRKDELDIFDISISRLTTAYLGFLDEMRLLSVEPASEFLVMAATLIHIKSALLLPRPTLGEEAGEDALDPREELVRRLLEYQRFREVARALEGLPRQGRDVFVRAAGLDRPIEPEDERALAEQDVYRLAEAFRRLVSQAHYTAPHDIHVERISLAERIAQIAERLAVEPRVTFEALLLEARHREEAITTFLALLEMARLALVRVIQGDRLGPLYVEARVGSILSLGEHAAGMLDEHDGAWGAAQSFDSSGSGASDGGAGSDVGEADSAGSAEGSEGDAAEGDEA